MPWRLPPFGMLEPSSGDFTCVAIRQTPTEAHLVKGALEAAGLHAYVADANLSQAHSWMTVALGGVRVLVPATQVGAAREILAALESGELLLDGEEIPVTSLSTLPEPVFSPDRAALLSVLLTPAFGAAVQIANAGVLGQTYRSPGRWLSLLVMILLSGLAVALVHEMNPGPTVVFRASAGLVGVTAVWYFVLGGHAQSRQLIDTCGPHYARKSLVAPALATVTAWLLVGWALNQFF